MKVELDLSTQLKDRAGVELNCIELNEACTIQDVIRTLVAKCGQDFQEFAMDDRGVLRPSIMLSINGKQVAWNENPPVNDGDRIGILSPIAGG